MKVYQLHLESGPKKRKTKVHIPELPGLSVNGPTTDEAVAAAPDGIRAYLRFLARHGVEADPEPSFETEVAAHFMEPATFIGQGSPYINLEGDLDPISEKELREQVQRFRWMREELAAWAAKQSEAALDAEPAEKGRTARSILLHVLGPSGSYLSAVMGGAPGFSRLHTLAERGEVPLPVALQQSVDMIEELVLPATEEQRSLVLQRPQDTRSLRKSMRFLLEHEWEHLSELARRQGGPTL